MTIDQLVKSKKDIIDFKTKYKEIYGIDLYIYAKKEEKKNIHIDLYIKCALECFKEEHPYLKHINKINYKTRLRCFLIYVQTICYLANKDGWSKNFIGKKISKNHATVVNSCRRIEDGLEVNDELVVKTYYQIINKLTKYVGAIPENLKRKDQSKSSVDTIWDEARRFIAQSPK